jgi:hypothetical protein
VNRAANLRRDDGLHRRCAHAAGIPRSKPSIVPSTGRVSRYTGRDPRATPIPSTSLRTRVRRCPEWPAESVQLRLVRPLFACRKSPLDVREHRSGQDATRATEPTRTYTAEETRSNCPKLDTGTAGAEAHTLYAGMLLHPTHLALRRLGSM